MNSELQPRWCSVLQSCVAAARVPLPIVGRLVGAARVTNGRSLPTALSRMRDLSRAMAPIPACWSLTMRTRFAMLCRFEKSCEGLDDQGMEGWSN